ncbi:hypothetical protein KR038_010129 [Drosophila bunnanda]|nr:hypothetical protein KR038_010129 [Drosophila bunnanda]
MEKDGTVQNGNQARQTARTARTSRRMRQSLKSEKIKETIEEEPVEQWPENRIIQQRVFLYIQLNELLNLPETSYPLELHLYHAKSTLQKMQERYTTKTIIYQKEFNLKKPVFTLGVMQDDIEEMNTFSDNPLLISLYQRIPRHCKGDSSTTKLSHLGTSPSISDASQSSGSKKSRRSRKSSTRCIDNMMSWEEPGEGEGEECAFVEERLELLSRGHCDLLQLFQRRRFISDINILLYPMYQRPEQEICSKKITSTTVWHMYSILPVLKNFNFTNLAFMSLESIYNVPEELHIQPTDLGMSVSFRSTQPKGENGVSQTIPLCTFSGFGWQIISDQNTSIVWENLKRDLNPHVNFGFNQMETNSRIKLPRLFRMLLWEQDADISIQNIDPLTDKALINNSLHRFVINEEMRKILEESVLNNSYELLLQLYRDTPDNVLYEGVINPSIFGYPGVNYCRFATRLIAVNASHPDPHPPSEGPRLGPMFCTFKICFFQPICERNEPLDKYNENLLKRSKLRRCFDIQFLNEDESDRDLLSELYREFDKLISDTIQIIVKKDVHSIEEKNEFFCCLLGNLSNLLMKICGCDFNIRMPTKTNIEFRVGLGFILLHIDIYFNTLIKEMLTHMYKELIERVRGILTACSYEGLPSSQKTKDQNMIRLMNEMRLVGNIGQRDLAITMYDEIDNSTTNRVLFSFVTLINNVENLQFQQAARFFTKPRSTDWRGEVFILLLKLYVDYMIDLRSEDEEISTEAFSNMLENLRQLASKGILEMDPWILLYCYYKQVNYQPGMEFTRWKFENLYEIPEQKLDFSILSLYELYLPVDFEMKITSTVMNTKFYPVFKLFARLGAFVFAEVVFANIEQCFTAVEVYLIKTTLKILQRQIDDKFKIQTISTDKSEYGKMMRKYQLHINGNVEYSRGRCDEALKYFEELLNVTDPEDRPYFKLSLLRLGQLAFDKGLYELAVSAFDTCIPASKKQKIFLPNYCKGLALYHVSIFKSRAYICHGNVCYLKLNRLEEAIPFLSRCTEVNIFIPDVWGYLATINLRLNRNKTALECWKVAKMYPEVNISNGVYAELDKIKISDVHLLVDNDGNPAEKMGKSNLLPL